MVFGQFLLVVLALPSSKPDVQATRYCFRRSRKSRSPPTDNDSDYCTASENGEECSDVENELSDVEEEVIDFDIGVYHKCDTNPIPPVKKKERPKEREWTKKKFLAEES